MLAQKSSQHKYGQYFTTNKTLQEKVFKYIYNNPDIILEPSFGRGDLVKSTHAQFNSFKKKSVSYDMFEIDEKIKMLDGIKNGKSKLSFTFEYCDFLTKKIVKTYKTIIGNPPYVKTKKGNLYIQFIDKCVDLLENNGELIFIIPSDFFKLTMAKKTLIKMMRKGSFTHIYHPNDEKLFKNASIDILIFRYIKNPTIHKKVLYDNSVTTKLLHINNSDGLITFTDKSRKNMKKIEDIFDVYVGIVSGRDKVYKNKILGNIDVLTTRGSEKYIYTKKYPSGNDAIDKHLLSHKNELIARKIRKFNKTNWFEWGAPRNVKKMEEFKGQECIYVVNITRKAIIAFKGSVQYFSGSLIMLKPKNKIEKTLGIGLSVLIDKTLSCLNNDIRKLFTYSGRFKVGHRSLSKSYIDL